MCGIVGYAGKKQVVPILLRGLKMLEYRGYDSAGVALVVDGSLDRRRAVGKIASLEKLLKARPVEGTTGIGHTRWATHGRPSVENAHPHFDCHGRIALAHNGIIENAGYLKQQLVEEGHRFTSETDTEVLVHLVEKYYQGDLGEAARKALTKVEGTYGITLICAGEPHTMVAARKGSPLIIGVLDGEFMVASDVGAMVEHTRRMIYLEDNEMAVFRNGRCHTSTIDARPIAKKIEEVDWNIDMINKGGHRHFMLKEICEQPDSLANALLGRLPAAGGVKLGGLQGLETVLRSADRVILAACGTSWHSALVGKYLIEEHARVPVEVDYASEFRYRDPILDPKSLLFVISQSGETADTLAALREAKSKGATALGICNVVGSTIARESDGGIYLHAGPEIGVASTKAFTSQIAVLSLIAALMGELRDGQKAKISKLVSGLKHIPSLARQVIDAGQQVEACLELFEGWGNSLYLARAYNFPVALEGALKLKEISYLHAEGYPAAEMKHGPIALITRGMPVVVIVPRDKSYAKVLSNIEEVRARGGRVIAVASEGDRHIHKLADRVIAIPDVYEPLLPILTVIPLQLLAYHVAVARGCDVDQPRNLAKSVTVE